MHRTTAALTPTGPTPSYKPGPKDMKAMEGRQLTEDNYEAGRNRRGVCFDNLIHTGTDAYVMALSPSANAVQAAHTMPV